MIMKSHLLLAVVLTIFGTFLVKAADAPALHQGELIFPLESWHNHSSSIVELPNGSLLVCWFHGSGERKADDVKIEAARWNPATRKWSERFTLADTPGFPDTNPVLFLDSRKRLFLFWPVIIANLWETALMKYRISSDYQQAEGPPKWDYQDNILLIPKNIAEKTKAVASTVPEGPLKKEADLLVQHSEDKYFSRMGWFTRTHPIELSPGHILVPMYSDGYSFGIMAITRDAGITWIASEPIVGFGGIQPSVVRRKDGTLVAYLRDNGPAPKRVQMATSSDEGVSWSNATDTDIPNPGSSLEAIRLKNGNWLMIGNDLEKGRYSLVAALSDDEGKTWKWRRHLEGNPAKPSQGRYHYPSVIQASDGNIHVTYSYFLEGADAPQKGKSIKHVMINEQWIKTGN